MPMRNEVYFFRHLPLHPLWAMPLTLLQLESKHNGVRRQSWYESTGSTSTIPASYHREVRMLEFP